MLGMCQDRQIVDDRAATEIEEGFPLAAIASATPLPVTKMSEGMFHRHALAQLDPPGWG